MPLLAAALACGLFLAGDSAPLAYLPVLNPLELALIGLSFLLFGLAGSFPLLKSSRRWLAPAGIRLRDHGDPARRAPRHGEPWTPDILDSGFSQASLTVVWSLCGVGALDPRFAATRSPRLDRWRCVDGHRAGRSCCSWIDWSYIGNMPGIVSFIAVGLLLVGVGYVAPSPPRSLAETGEANMRFALLLAALMSSSGAVGERTRGFCATVAGTRGYCGTMASVPRAIATKSAGLRRRVRIGLDESVYRQIATRADLADMAAFNADGQALAVRADARQLQPAACGMARCGLVCLAASTSRPARGPASACHPIRRPAT